MGGSAFVQALLRCNTLHGSVFELPLSLGVEDPYLKGGQVHFPVFLIFLVTLALHNALGNHENGLFFTQFGFLFSGSLALLKNPEIPMAQILFKNCLSI